MRRYPTPHSTIVTTEWILLLLNSIAIIPARKKGKYSARGTPYNGLYVEAPPERGTFFRQRVGILLVKVYERLINLFVYLSTNFSDL